MKLPTNCCALLAGTAILCMAGCGTGRMDRAGPGQAPSVSTGAATGRDPTAPRFEMVASPRVVYVPRLDEYIAYVRLNHSLPRAGRSRRGSPDATMLLGGAFPAVPIGTVSSSPPCYANTYGTSQLPDESPPLPTLHRGSTTDIQIFAGKNPLSRSTKLLAEHRATVSVRNVRPNHSLNAIPEKIGCKPSTVHYEGHE